MDQEEEEEEKDNNKCGIAYPVRVTKQEFSLHVNLLLAERDGVWHYSTIKNFSGFLCSQYSKHCGKTFYCYSCLRGFQAKTNEKTREECVLLQENIKYCKQQKPQRVSYPENATTEFRNIHKTLKQPFVGYADFECILVRVNEAENCKLPNHPIKKSNTSHIHPLHTLPNSASIDPEIDFTRTRQL